ncbi:hypothetical protein LshimejAT787_0200730 [Lyophyllum shimeji]|uniref:Uncharacterized protein n=1 Tax=Lyophyllum shimeji TaxID=47721 RepID=A0A9P3UIK2_LYOSH|nr:hypothetical protein LshimejAT787_0200730 [Lyophyllum shimeji]
MLVDLGRMLLSYVQRAFRMSTSCSPPVSLNLDELKDGHFWGVEALEDNLKLHIAHLPSSAGYPFMIRQVQIRKNPKGAQHEYAVITFREQSSLLVLERMGPQPTENRTKDPLGSSPVSPTSSVSSSSSKAVDAEDRVTVWKKMKKRDDAAVGTLDLYTKDVYLHQVILLACAIRETAPEYDLLKSNCYYFAGTLVDALAQRSGTTLQLKDAVEQAQGVAENEPNAEQPDTVLAEVNQRNPPMSHRTISLRAKRGKWGDIQVYRRPTQAYLDKLFALYDERLESFEKAVAAQRAEADTKTQVAELKRQLEMQAAETRRQLEMQAAETRRQLETQAAETRRQLDRKQAELDRKQAEIEALRRELSSPRSI